VSRLIVAALVRNEANKYWRSALDAWEQFADKIVVLDDASTDRTFAIAEKRERVSAYQRVATKNAWGAESSARAELYSLAIAESRRGDYLLWLDADMVPAQDPRELITVGLDAYAFPLYDLWGQDEQARLLYREDGFWCAHLRPRIWMIRRPGTLKPTWSARGVHCGHLPANYEARSAMYMPPSHALLHYGYFDERDRASKHASYLSVRDQLSVQEVAHAHSIVDKEPNLKPLFDEPKYALKRHT
jgi:glycosyltransferase involved in cell wall biosynthesis